jgi:hypothetical protein
MEAVGFFETLVTIRQHFVIILKIDMIWLSERELTINQSIRSHNLKMVAVIPFEILWTTRPHGVIKLILDVSMIIRLRSINLKMKAADSFEMLVNNYQTTRCHSLENGLSMIIREVVTTNQSTRYHNLKIEAATPFETLITIYHTAGCHNPKRLSMIIRKGANHKPGCMFSTWRWRQHVTDTHWPDGTTTWRVTALRTSKLTRVLYVCDMPFLHWGLQIPAGWETYRIERRSLKRRNSAMCTWVIMIQDD